MPRTCTVPGCRNRKGLKSKNGVGLSYHCIPTVIKNQGDQTEKLAAARRKRWLRVLKLTEAEVDAGTNVCSAHFKSGKPAPLYNTENIDWVPNVFGDSALENGDRLCKTTNFKKGWRG